MAFNFDMDRWSEEEIEALKDIVVRSRNAKDFLERVKESILVKKRTIQAIHRKRRKEGLLLIHKWTEEEQKLIERWIGLYSVDKMSELLERRGIKRTPTAIQLCISRMGYSTKQDLYTTNDVALGFGCDRKTILTWIRQGRIKGKRGDNDSKHDYRIKPEDVADFIRKNPYQLNKFRVNVAWIVSLLDEFKGKKGGKECQYQEEL